MSRYIVFTLMLFSLLGCEKELKSVGKNSDQISKTIQEYVSDPSKSVEEIEKLHQVEYSVFSIPAENSSVRYEGALDQMGKKRWDCFHVENIKSLNQDGKIESNLMFFCKRTPETLLRYVPKSLIGR